MPPPPDDGEHADEALRLSLQARGLGFQSAEGLADPADRASGAGCDH